MFKPPEGAADRQSNLSCLLHSREPRQVAFAAELGRYVAPAPGAPLPVSSNVRRTLAVPGKASCDPRECRKAVVLLPGHFRREVV